MVQDVGRIQEIWQAVLEAAPAGVAVFDLDMRYVEASLRWKQDYGLTGESIIGRSHYEIFPEIPERWKEVHRRCLAGAVERCDADPFPRSDGETEWVRWEVRPWHQADGQVSGIVIFSETITARKVLENRLALLVRASEVFHRSLHIGATLDNVGQLVTESFADICLFDVIDDRAAFPHLSAAVSRDRSKCEQLRKATSFLYDDEYRVHPAVQVAASGETLFVPDVPDDVDAHAASARHARFMKQLEYRSEIIVPVTAQGRIFGALTFVRTGDRRRFDADDVNLAQELGRRSGVALANAKRYQQEHRVAVTLQRAFVNTTFPARPGVSFHGIYLPGNTEADIGGDWYDAFELRDGSLVITIGDVAGKGVEAARQMVQIRQSIRIAAVVTSAPGKILAITNSALLQDRIERHASAFVMVIASDNQSAVYALAGHPPPFVRSCAGAVTRLASPSPPLGIDSDMRFEERSQRLCAGDALLLYSDGAIEAFRDPTLGEALLHDAFACKAFSYAADPASFLQRVVAGAPTHDDVALLVLRFGAADRCWRFHADNPRSAYSAKARFVAALHSFDPWERSDIRAAEFIFSELIGNAVQHAPGPVSLTLSNDGRGNTLHVIDQGPGFDFDPVLPDDVWSEAGRGLFLVSKLARDVQVERLPGCGSYIAVGLPEIDEARSASPTMRLDR